MSGEEARVAKEKGTQCFKEGDFAGAESAFSTAIELDGSNETLYANRSAVRAKLGKLAEALSDADKCIELKPEWVRGHTRRAQALQALGRLEEAEAAVQQALQRDGNDAMSQQVADAIARQLAADDGPDGLPEDALFSLAGMFGEPALWEAVKQNPQVAPLLNNPGTLMKIEQLKSNPKMLSECMSDPVMSAVVSAFMMAKLQGISPEAAAAMSKAQQQQDRQTPSEHQQEQSSSSSSSSSSKPKEKPAEPERPPLTAEQQQAVDAKEEGNKAYAAKDWDRALELYNRAIELDDQNILYRLNRASVYMMTSRFDECLSECDEAIAHGKAIYAPFEHRAKAYHRKGRCYLRMDKLDEAIKCFDASMTEHRTAECLKDLRDTERLRDRRAKEAYLDPELARQEKEKGSQLFQQGRLPEAVEAFSEAIKRNPADHTVYSNRSFCYLKLGAFAEALRDAEETIRIDPKFVKGYIRKAQVHFRQKDYHKAVAVYEQALAIDPDSQAVKEGLQETIRAIHERRMSGKIDEAAQKRALADPEIQKILGNDEVQTFLRTSGQNPKEANEMLKKRPALAKNVDILMAAGVI